MTTIERVSWDDPRAVRLREAMDVEMHARYGDGGDDDPDGAAAERTRVLAVHPEHVVATLLALDDDGTPIGHIAVRRLDDHGVPEIELKRLVVLAEARGKGAATALLDESERVGRELGARRLVLQTGDKQPEAVALYEKTGWRRIPIYGEYAATMPFSLCFEKAL